MIKKIILPLLIILTICTSVIISNINVEAKSKANTLAELRAELKQWKKELEQIQGEQKRTQNQITKAKNNVLNSQIEIENNRKTIAAAQAESEKLDKDIEEGKKDLAKLIQTYQMAQGENVYLEYIFNATSYEELIYRYAVMEQIMDYQEEKIVEWKEKIEYNTQLKINLEKAEVDLNNKIDQLGKDIKNLQVELEDYFDTAMDVKDDIAATEKTIKMYEDLGCKENEDLTSCAKVVADTKFLKPFAKGVVTSEYGSRTHPVTGKANTFHRGMDLAGPGEGSEIRSVARGMVAFVITKSASSASCGGQRVYIHHIIGGKKYTSEYMHLLRIDVKPGDVVTSDTVIGLMGGGKQTKTYDKCTTGAHLHFGLGTGWYKGGDYTTQSEWYAHIVNPKSYLNLPAKGVYWYSR